MKKLLLLTAVFMAGLVATSPDASARGRQNTGNNNGGGSRPTTISTRNTIKTTPSPTRNTGASKTGTTINTRPQATMTKQPVGNITVTPRPGNSGSSATQRPGGNPGASTQRPGGNSGSATPPPSNPGTSTQRPGGNPGASTQRPGGNTGPATPPPSNPGTSTQRPGGNHGASNQRPGGSGPGNGGVSQRPPTPNVRPTPPPPGHNRPGGPGVNARPPMPMRPPQPPRPTGYRPGYSYRPPMPHIPPLFHYYRPTPPPSWRPTIYTPTFGTFLGLTLGAMLATTVNSLCNSGYNVVGYTNDEVYLNNVEYCNVSWPNATMYYKNGYLEGSVFSSSTYSYDISRYNYVYSYLTGLYGMPVSSQNLTGGGMSCTWWGNNNTYMTLSYYPESVNGTVYYFTTLSTGK